MNDCTKGQVGLAGGVPRRMRSCYSPYPLVAGAALAVPVEASCWRIAAMQGIWRDMFVITLPILEKILRPVIVYFFLVVMLRLSGKRELVQLNPFDLVVLLTLSNTVQNAIIGDDNSVSGGLLGATSLLVVNYLNVRFLYHPQNLDLIGEGGPV